MDFGKHLVVDIETGNQVYIDLTLEEIAERQKIADEIFVELATKEQAKKETITQRQALLDKLGITEDEARLLLGGIN